jgi:hypothetical protein
MIFGSLAGRNRMARFEPRPREADRPLAGTVIGFRPAAIADDGPEAPLRTRFTARWLGIGRASYGLPPGPDEPAKPALPP